jgi:hypothetical protein
MISRLLVSYNIFRIKAKPPAFGLAAASFDRIGG